MIFVIDNILTPEELNFIVDSLEKADFVDGKTTAGWFAKLVKNNMQLQGDLVCAKDLQQLVTVALKRNPLFRSVVHPKIIHSVLFSRYETGMSYGRHVDNPFMNEQEFWRSDVSFTLFLTSPSTYQGGELRIQGSDGDRICKLDVGSMIIYPSSSLHQVEPVTEGVRLAAVGWVQSLVRDANAREILFDLNTAQRSIFAKQGKTIEFDLISKSYANLLRRWGE